MYLLGTFFSMIFISSKSGHLNCNTSKKSRSNTTYLATLLLVMFKVKNVKKKRMVKLLLYLKNKKMVLCKLLIVFEQKKGVKGSKRQWVSTYKEND